MWGIFFLIIILVIVHRALQVNPDRRTAGIPFIALVIVSAIAGLAFTLTTGRETAGSASLLATVIVVVAIGAGAWGTRPFRIHILPLVGVVLTTATAGFVSSFAPSAAVAIGLAAAALLFALADWTSPARFYPWTFVAVGCLTVASTEFVFVVDDLQGGAWQRMNTVFKFYFQAWTLIAIGSASSSPGSSKASSGRRSTVAVSTSALPHNPGQRRSQSKAIARNASTPARFSPGLRLYRCYSASPTLPSGRRFAFAKICRHRRRA